MLRSCANSKALPIAQKFCTHVTVAFEFSKLPNQISRTCFDLARSAVSSSIFYLKRSFRKMAARRVRPTRRDAPLFSLSLSNSCARLFALAISDYICTPNLRSPFGSVRISHLRRSVVPLLSPFQLTRRPIDGINRVIKPGIAPHLFYLYLTITTKASVKRQIC